MIIPYNIDVMIKKLIIPVLIFASAVVIAADNPVGGDPNSADTKPVEQKVEQPAAVTAEPNNTVLPQAAVYVDNTLNSKCRGVLNNEFIDDGGYVDYKLLRRKRSQLYDIVREFEKLEVDQYIKWESDDQTAFWINAHNIMTMKLIVDNYPIQSSRFKLIFYPGNSIMQIDGARQSNYFNIMGREYSLEELEKNVLELYKDPRVLFALNYASLGSAPMRNEPYIGRELETQIDNQVRKLLVRRTGFYIDKSVLSLSPIFEWHIKEFTEYYGTDVRYRAHPKETRAIFNFIEKFKGQGWSKILESDKFELRYQNFDWRLNEKP